jgi:hypothetical protein
LRGGLVTGSDLNDAIFASSQAGRGGSGPVSLSQFSKTKENASIPDKKACTISASLKYCLLTLHFLQVFCRHAGGLFSPACPSFSFYSFSSCGDSHFIRAGLLHPMCAKWVLCRPQAFYPFKLHPVSPLIRNTKNGIASLGELPAVNRHATIVFLSGASSGITQFMARIFHWRMDAPFYFILVLIGYLLSFKT